MGVGNAGRSGLSASSPKKNRLKSFVIEAAISSICFWDKIPGHSPLLRQTTCLLHGKGTTHGKNAILKAMNLEEGATAKDRNAQIGGHKA